MPTIEISNDDLLDAVRQMSRKEFDTFIEQALSIHTQSKATTLSAEETKLIKRINLGLPAELRNRHARLTARRKKSLLTEQEHQELLKLTHDAESRDADRAAALLELAKLRQVPLRTLMKQMGIQAPPIHG